LWDALAERSVARVRDRITAAGLSALRVDGRDGAPVLLGLRGAVGSGGVAA
jgi:hypothetical protein